MIPSNDCHIYGACGSKKGGGERFYSHDMGLTSDKGEGSSNINEVIRSVLNFLLFFFFTIRFHKYKKAKNVIKTIQFFKQSHYSMFRSHISKFIYYFRGISVIKIILIFNRVLIN